MNNAYLYSSKKIKINTSRTVFPDAASKIRWIMIPAVIVTDK